VNTRKQLVISIRSFQCRLVVVATAERSGSNSSVTFYKPSLVYRVLSSQGRLLLKMSFQRDAVSLGLLGHGVQEMTVSLVDSPPDCFKALPLDLGARSSAAMDLLVKDLRDILPSNGNHDDRLPSNADHQIVCRQVGLDFDSLRWCLMVKSCTSHFAVPLTPTVAIIMSTAIKPPAMPDQVQQSFVIFDTRAL